TGGAARIPARPGGVPVFLRLARERDARARMARRRPRGPRGATAARVVEEQGRPRAAVGGRATRRYRTGRGTPAPGLPERLPRGGTADRGLSQTVEEGMRCGWARRAHRA